MCTQCIKYYKMHFYEYRLIACLHNDNNTVLLGNMFRFVVISVLTHQISSCLFVLVPILTTINYHLLNHIDYVAAWNHHLTHGNIVNRFLEFWLFTSSREFDELIFIMSYLYILL